jgi:hypothetical protein
MITRQKHEETPWRPRVESEPELNPFVNPLDRSGELENQPPLDHWEPEEAETSNKDGSDTAALVPREEKA